jgi:hypothetical protein
MSARDQQMRGMYFKIQNWNLNRCLAPGPQCPNTAIRAHTVQNGRVMDILERSGHVKRIVIRSTNAGVKLSFEDIGRNLASTFEGFCSTHGTQLFIPIDTTPLDPTNEEQLFLLTYRSVARETHSVMEGASKIQSAYQSRIQVGIDTGLEPEPVGLQAVAHMANAYETWEYKERLDTALLKRDFQSLRYIVIAIQHTRPALAVSSTFTLEDRKETKTVRLTINLIPQNLETSFVIFGFLPENEQRVREFLMRILDTEDDYQKYLLSKLILTHCENFVISPTIFDSWSTEKVSAVEGFFRETLHENKEREDQNLYLFN